MCVHAQSTYTCTIRWVHVPQWCCLATVWRSVFLLWAPDNDFGQNVLFHSKSSPVYIKKRGQEKSPLLSSVWAGNSCLTQFHQRVIKRPMRGDRGYVCTFHSDRSTPPLAAFEQNCPNSLSCSIFGTVGVSVATNSIIHFIGTRHWRTYELGVTVRDVSESRVTLRDSESKLWLTRKKHYCCNWHCTATVFPPWWKITDGGGQRPSECH